MNPPLIKAYRKGTEAYEKNSSGRCGFSDASKSEAKNAYGDPWIEWHLSEGRPLSSIRNIVLLQDWGCKDLDSEPLDSSQVTRFLSSESKESTVRGLRKIFDQADLSKPVKIPEDTFIFNAVWGLRPGDKRSGVLPKPSLTFALPHWLEIVKVIHLHSIHNDSLRLIFAGSWACECSSKSSNLQEHITKWANRFPRWKNPMDTFPVPVVTNIPSIKTHFQKHPSAPGFSKADASAWSTLIGTT